MAKIVELPDGREAEFPDSMSNEEIANVLNKQFGNQQATQQRQSAAPPPSARRQSQQDVARERAANINTLPGPPPAQLANRETRGVFDRARDAAREAGVDPSRPAPYEARTALALSAPSAEMTATGRAALEPEEQARIVRNALGEDYEVRVGPDTGELEYKTKDQDQFALVNPPGFNLSDLAAAGPESGRLGLGVVGGLGGLKAGATTGNPLLAGAGTTIGVAVGEGTGAKVSLERAREQGYLPEITDEEITARSLERGLEAAIWTAGGGVIARGTRQLLARQLGASPEVVEALANTANVDEAFERARDLKTRAKGATGEDLPMTAGQAADSPEMRIAERTAARQGGGEQLTDIFEGQRRFQENLERQTLGTPVTPDERARVAQTFERKAKEDVDRLEARTESAVSPLRERAGATPERAAAIARGEIVLGRRQLFNEEFASRYQTLFGNEALTEADLAPLRQTAENLRDQRGQKILPSLSLTDQKVLKEAEQAGLTIDSELTLNSNNLLEWTNKLTSENASLTEVQNALVDIRRELRRPGIVDDPQKASILRELESSLEGIRSRAVGPQKQQQLAELDAEYARASADYNQSFVDEFTTLRADGTPVVTSDTAFERIVRSPEEADTFVEAMGRLPTGGEALTQFRRGVISHVLDKSTKNGEISEAALRRYLDGPKRRALSRIFEGEDIAEQFDSVADAAKAVRERRNQYQAASRVTDRILGESFVSPNKIANEVYAKIDDLTPERIGTVRSALPKSERGLFDRALATEVRNELVDSNGRIQPNKIDNFLQSNGSRVARSVFGDVYLSNLRTLRDVAQLRQPVTEQTAGRPINEQLSQIFQRGIGGAEGMQKFLRVPFPPLSVKGRALTATLGQLQERGQRQLVEILSDPSRFNDLRRLLSTDFYSRNYDKIAARVGLSSLVQFKDIVEGNVAIPETVEENQSPQSISPTL